MRKFLCVLSLFAMFGGSLFLASCGGDQAAEEAKSKDLDQKLQDAKAAQAAKAAEGEAAAEAAVEVEVKAE